MVKVTLCPLTELWEFHRGCLIEAIGGGGITLRASKDPSSHLRLDKRTWQISKWSPMYYISVRTPSASLPLCTFISDLNILTLREEGERSGGACALFNSQGEAIEAEGWPLTHISHPEAFKLEVTGRQACEDPNRTAFFLSSHWSQPHPISARWPHTLLYKHSPFFTPMLPWRLPKANN